VYFLYYPLFLLLGFESDSCFLWIFELNLNLFFICKVKAHYSLDVFYSEYDELG